MIVLLGVGVRWPCLLQEAPALLVRHHLGRIEHRPPRLRCFQNPAPTLESN